MGFEQQTASSRARNSSPDSENFSFFSSASASADRDSQISEISLQLAGDDDEENHESCGGPDPDSNKNALSYNKGENAKVRKDDSIVDIEDGNRVAVSARNSFSLALKECQDQRSKSQAQSMKLDRRRPVSLDINNGSKPVSPRLVSVKKNSVVTTRKNGTFPSPDTANYRHNSFGMQNGWRSEQVPLHNNCGWNHIDKPTLLSLNRGTTLPSKWEDAERWISSPVSSDGVARNSVQHPQRRPKSKSGPLGPPGIAYYSFYSHAAPAYERGTFGNFDTGSPFSAGVISTNRLGVHSGGHEGSFHEQIEPSLARSVSIHGCSEMSGQLSSSTSLQEESEEHLTMGKDNRMIGRDVCCVVSRRDMATQMSPESSVHSSPSIMSSTTASRSSATHMFDMGAITSKLELGDVQVDNQVTMTRWSKKRTGSIPWKDALNDWRKKDADAVSRCSELDIPDIGKSLSKVKREEAKITAWENHERAKAEAAIRKLEMKLEKKRAASMDKIANKLKYSQKKAEEMRNLVMENQTPEDSRTSSIKFLSFNRTRHMASLSGCFTCHAF